MKLLVDSIDSPLSEFSVVVDEQGHPEAACLARSGCSRMRRRASCDYFFFGNCVGSARPSSQSSSTVSLSASATT